MKWMLAHQGVSSLHTKCFNSFNSANVTQQIWPIFISLYMFYRIGCLLRYRTCFTIFSRQFAVFIHNSWFIKFSSFFPFINTSKYASFHNIFQSTGNTNSLHNKIMKRICDSCTNFWEWVIRMWLPAFGQFPFPWRLYSRKHLSSITISHVKFW